MSRRVVICMVLTMVLLSGGCQDVSTKELSAMILACSIGFVISSWLVVIPLTLLVRRLNLIRNRAVLLQYVVYVLIQVIISLRLGLLRSDLDVSIAITMFILLPSVPYLLLVGSILILLLPVRLLSWVPSFLLVPYYLVFGLVYVTNPKWPRMNEATIFLISILLHVAIFFVVVIIIVLFIRKRSEGSRP